MPRKATVLWQKATRYPQNRHMVDTSRWSPHGQDTPHIVWRNRLLIENGQELGLTGRRGAILLHMRLQPDGFIEIKAEFLFRHQRPLIHSRGTLRPDIVRGPYPVPRAARLIGLPDLCPDGHITAWLCAVHHDPFQFVSRIHGFSGLHRCDPSGLDQSDRFLVAAVADVSHVRCRGRQGHPPIGPD